MLPLRSNDSSRLLVQSLVVPVGINLRGRVVDYMILAMHRKALDTITEYSDTRLQKINVTYPCQPIGNAIVFPHPDGVNNSQARLLGRPRIASPEAAAGICLAFRVASLLHRAKVETGL